jgi:tetratricopeptide (TPR) repeat protein
MLERRRAAAEAGESVDGAGGEGPGKLLPSEMIDDALARGTASSLKWLQRNWATVQWFVAAGIVLGVGGLIYTYQVTSDAEEASAELADGVHAEQALIQPESDDKRTDKEKQTDPRLIFVSRAKRDEAALSNYRKAALSHPDIGPGILARLGEAGVLLDQAHYDKAIEAYDHVLATPLAAADIDVKARALEGKGFAFEGKKDLDAASKAFEALGKLDEAGYRITAKYHRARIALARGKREEAKQMLIEARKKVETANLDASTIDGAQPYRWLEGAILASLRLIDPSAAPKKPRGGGLSQEQLQQMLRQRGLSGGVPGLPGGIPGR